VVNDLISALGDLGLPGLCLAVAVLAFAETAILLDLAVPGEVGLVLAGAAAAAGGHPIAPVVVAAALGAVVGDTVSYSIGRRWGRSLIERFALTRRRLLPMVDRAEAHFADHGGRSVFFGRWVGALRAVIPFAAGIGRLELRTFLAWNVAASLTWAGAVVLAGWWLGEPIADVVDRIGTVLSVVVVAVIAAVWWWRAHHGHAARRPGERGPQEKSGEPVESSSARS
jgi:membrane-associated protein